MRKISALFVLILLVINIVSAQDTLRIMTFNIEAGVSGKITDIGNYIKQLNPDIVALQEIDQWAYRKKRISPVPENQMVELASFTDMLPVFGQTCDFGGGYYGIGLLTKYNIESYQRILLPQTDSQYEPRVLIIVGLDVHGKKITIANTHLSLVEKDRTLQIKFIARQLRKIKGHKILCGDFNANPTEISTTKLAKYHDALPENQNTFPSVNPRTKLDYIILDPKDNINVISHYIDTSCDLSDHCPCYVDIILNN